MLTVTLVFTIPPAIGDVIVEVGGTVSGVVLGVLGLLVIPHPE
jgi:hypothetical protein